jgi:hypothetical protein
MVTVVDTNRVHQTGPAPTRSWHVGVAVNRSLNGRSQLGCDTLSTAVQQRQRACNDSTSAVDVLNTGDDRLGLLGDGLHVPQAVIEIVCDPIEEHADDEEKHRQNSGQCQDDDYGQDDKSHI